MTLQRHSLPNRSGNAALASAGKSEPDIGTGKKKPWQYQGFFELHAIQSQADPF